MPHFADEVKTILVSPKNRSQNQDGPAQPGPMGLSFLPYFCIFVQRAFLRVLSDRQSIIDSVLDFRLIRSPAQ